MLLASGCGASSLSTTALEQQLVSRGLARADCSQSASVEPRFATRAERKESGVTWCRAWYVGQRGSVPFPVRVEKNAATVPPSRGCHDVFRAVPSGRFGNYREVDGLGVRAWCRDGRDGVGWYLTAGWGLRQRYASAPIGYGTPVGVVAIYPFARRVLPVIVAQVGAGMIVDPYELFTFSGAKIVPVRVRLKGGIGLGAGGAAFHGMGLFCSSQRSKLVITEVSWNGPRGDAPMVRDKGGGITPAGSDLVTLDSERVILGGQPLKQQSMVELPQRQITYRAANALEGAHCTSRG